MVSTIWQHDASHLIVDMALTLAGGPVLAVRALVVLDLQVHDAHVLVQVVLRVRPLPAHVAPVNKSVALIIVHQWGW